MKFVYDPEVPPEILVVIKQYLEPIGWFVPPWCQRVFVYWGERQDASTAIEAWCDYDYRRTTIKFYAPFLSCSEPLRREMVTHDLLHAFSGVYHEYVKDVIQRLLPGDENEKTRGIVMEELRVRNEGWVQDMAFCINQLGVAGEGVLLPRL